ncbi:MAG TPA: CheR family methyltransferase [Burkholderiaceae bacterium]|nr:CheR family methyltransferase [Burkholderiaceae bacterium]
MGARDALTELAPGAAVAALVAEEREFAFSQGDFERVRRLIYARAGISLNDSKQNMVYGRLARRLRATGVRAFPEYLDRIESDARFAGGEVQEFVNALTTNLTAFFREPHHFPILSAFLAAQADGSRLRLWCAAAATGEEPYSMAMTLLEALGPETGARVLATDIDTSVLAHARRGIYRSEDVQACGDARMRRFFLRGRGTNVGMVRVRPELERVIEFAPVNLLEPDWEAQRRFAAVLDVVFLRNVMIYFDRSMQRRILARIASVLRRGGLLFVGHSENFTDCRAHFALRGKTVYERI